MLHDFDFNILKFEFLRASSKAMFDKTQKIIFYIIKNKSSRSLDSWMTCSTEFAGALANVA